MMLGLGSAAALAAGLAALLRRAVPRPSAPRAGRGSRRGTRCVVAALALGLALNGIGLCLCAPRPAKAGDPHSCCPNRAGDDAGAPAAGTVVTASTSCCASPLAPGLAARIDDRETLRDTLNAVAATYVSLAGRIAPSTFGVSAPSLGSSSPPRTTTVLRI